MGERDPVPFSKQADVLDVPLPRVSRQPDGPWVDLAAFLTGAFPHAVLAWQEPDRDGQRWASLTHQALLESIKAALPKLGAKVELRQWPDDYAACERMGFRLATSLDGPASRSYHAVVWVRRGRCAPLVKTLGEELAVRGARIRLTKEANRG